MKNPKTKSRRRARPRVPVAYAGLLIVALFAVVGFAAFSPSSSSTDVTPTTVVASADIVAEPMTARVASAVLAIRVSDAGTRTGTTRATESSTVETAVPDTSGDVPATEDAADSVEETTVTTAAAELQSAPADTTAPSFEVTSPHDGATVDSTIVEFTGTVEKGSSVRSGPFEARVADDGTWSLSLALVAGANGASFTATDSAGNTASQRIVVTYNPPAPTPAPAPTPTTTAPHTDSPTTAPHDDTPTTTTAPHDDTPTTTTAPHDDTPTTTTAPHDDTPTTTTKAPATSSKWSPKWPADAGGIRDVEAWRPLVAKYWAADRVDCVLGLIKVESRGDPRAYNASSGASGLMQHLIKYWSGRAAGAGFKDSNGLVASPYNAEANIAAGALIAGSGSKWYAPWGKLPSYGSCSG